MSIPASGSGSPCKTAADAATVGPVSSLKPLPGNAGYHGVHFYADQTRLCLSVTDFIADGIVADQPVLVIATPEHRQLITAQLALRRFDVAALKVQRKAIFLDAQTTMNKFMVSGNIDAARFHAVTGAAITSLCAGRPDCTVRAYGEMVDVLWRAGRSEQAIELEHLWNQLAGKHSFSLLCGYAMGNFYKETARADICALHSHIHD